MSKRKTGPKSFKSGFARSAKKKRKVKDTIELFISRYLKPKEKLDTFCVKHIVKQYKLMKTTEQKFNCLSYIQNKKTNYIIIRKVRKRTANSFDESWSTFFECPECGQNQCKVEQLQTRSGDEAMTSFCTCICGHFWKEE